MTDFSAFIRIDALSPHPDNPRKRFDEEALAELAESLKTHGLLEPLLVCKESGWDSRTNDRYTIICGERRWRAAQLAGMEKLLCVVRDMTRPQQLEAMLIENLHRENVDPVEEACGFQLLLTDAGYTQTDLAEAIGKSQPYVANRLRLLELPDAVLESISRGILSASAGRELVRLIQWPSICEEFAGRLVDEGISSKAAGAFIERELRRKARPLFKGSEWPVPEFNTKDFDDHPMRIMLRPASGGDPQPYLLDVAAWDDAQEAHRVAKALRRQKALEKLPSTPPPAKLAEPQGPNRAPEDVASDPKGQAPVAEPEPSSGEIGRALKLPSLSDLPYNAYERLIQNDVHFDTAVCEGCEFRKFARDYGGAEIVPICINPNEFKKKRQAAKKAERKALRDALEAEYSRLTLASLPWAQKLAVLDHRLLVYFAYQVLLDRERTHAGGYDGVPRPYPEEWVRKSLGDDTMPEAARYGRESHWAELVGYLELQSAERLARIIIEGPAQAHGAHALTPSGILLGDITPLPTHLRHLIPTAPDVEKPVTNMATCRVCGCTDEYGCDGGCYWVEPDLCSNCVDVEDGADGGTPGRHGVTWRDRVHGLLLDLDVEIEREALDGWTLMQLAEAEAWAKRMDEYDGEEDLQTPPEWMQSLVFGDGINSVPTPAVTAS